MQRFLSIGKQLTCQYQERRWGCLQTLGGTVPLSHQYTVSWSVAKRLTTTRGSRECSTERGDLTDNATEAATTKTPQLPHGGATATGEPAKGRANA